MDSFTAKIKTKNVFSVNPSFLYKVRISRDFIRWTCEHTDRRTGRRTKYIPLSTLVWNYKKKFKKSLLRIGRRVKYIPPSILEWNY